MLAEAVPVISKGSRSPRLDAELLLQEVSGLGRASLIAYPEREIPEKVASKFKELANRRADGEAIAYILGRKEFWGLEFEVGSGVLVPRPETELLVEVVLGLVKGRSGPLDVLDLGTGSGCVAIALALELQKRNKAFSLVASDISDSAISIAERNCKRHNVNFIVELRQSNWFSAFIPRVDSFDIIVSNPPYLAADDEYLLRPNRHEPTLALDGGRDGLDEIKKLIFSLSEFLKPGGFFLCEIGNSHSAILRGLIEGSINLEGKYKVNFHHDLGGVERVLELQAIAS